MKNFRTYYLVDTLSETIVGSFNAISDNMALKMVYEALKKNDKLVVSVNDMKLFCSDELFCVGETYDEVCDPDYNHEINIQFVVDELTEVVDDAG